jgi:hypothetical protein
MATKKKPAPSPTNSTNSTNSTSSSTPSPPARKGRLLAALRGALARDLEAVEAAAHAAHDAATHPEAKPENDKDTRAVEAGYLAGAQSARAAEVKRALAEFDRATSTSFSLLVLRESVKGHDVDSVVLLSPWGGGQKVDDGGTTVAVVSPKSPIGSALVGRSAGDVVEVEMGTRVREIEVVDVE